MGEQPEKYSLDKTVIRPSRVEEADQHLAYWQNKSLKQRLEAACYLINQFYGTTPQTQIDKTVFSKRKHKNG